jgi:MFS family permease
LEKPTKNNILLLATQQACLRMLPTGLLTVYPILLTNMKASKLEIGVFMSVSYIFFFAVTVLSGIVAPKYIGAKKLMLYTVFPAALFLMLMGFANTYLSFLIATCGMICCVGSNIATNSILVGMHCNTDDVGKVFGWVGISHVVASIIGTAIVGVVIQTLGKQTAFILFGAFVFISAVLLFIIKDNYGLQATASRAKDFKFKSQFLIALFTALLCIMMIHVFKMSLSLKLKSEGWQMKDISYTAAIGTLLSIGFPYIIGKLTQVLHAKYILMITYGTTALAMFLLPYLSTTLQVIAGVCLISILAYASRPAMLKLIYMWYPEKDRPQAQSYSSSAAWIAAIVGYLFTGILLEKISLQQASILSGGLCLMAIFIVWMFITKKEYIVYKNNTF